MYMMYRVATLQFLVQKTTFSCALECSKLRAYEGWKRWFDAADASGIPALMKFAELKRPRLDGLVAHAVFPISTGKLEGFNNRIKVAKRIGYGYWEDDYFFTLIRYLALPTACFSSLIFP